MQKQPQKTPTALRKKLTSLGLTLLAGSLLTSCANSNLSQIAKKSADSVSNFIPSRVPIAQVRPGDLKKIPSGADRALAWDRHLDSQRYAATPSWWKPANYQTPSLPSTRSMPTGGGILPPLHPGQSTSLETRGSMPPN